MFDMIYNSLSIFTEYVILPIIITTGYLLIQIDVPTIICNEIEKKYKKYKRVNKLVSSKYKNPFMIHFISIKTIIQATYINFLQYINNSVLKVDKNTYEVSYVIEGKIYRMIVKPLKGPSPILQINDGIEDITDIVLPYLGPNYNWHYTKFSPEFFDKKSLITHLNSAL